jgi:hypothetical protein
MRATPWLMVLVAAFVTSACNRTQPPPFKPVADVKGLMNDIVEPAADDVFAASGWIETKDGVFERGPTTNEEWIAVRNRAMTVAEAGNLLMMAPRAKDGGQWMTFARAMVDKGEECVKAADARSKQRMFDMGGELYQTCLNCHMEYLPAIRDALKGVRSQEQ